MVPALPPVSEDTGPPGGGEGMERRQASIVTCPGETCYDDHDKLLTGSADFNAKFEEKRRLVLLAMRANLKILHQKEADRLAQTQKRSKLNGTATAREHPSKVEADDTNTAGNIAPLIRRNCVQEFEIAFKVLKLMNRSEHNS